LHKDDKMTVTFQVGDREFGSAGNLDVDFWVGSRFPLPRMGGVAYANKRPDPKSRWRLRDTPAIRLQR